MESQIELAEKNLQDKNWQGAIAQAERALNLRPESGKARLILEQAKRKRGQLEAAALQARRAFEAGNAQEASQALSRVLELDPKHPVVSELTARLNSTFRFRAEEAGRLTERARADAEKARATGLDFAQAAALAKEGDTLFEKSEFADATQRYLEARDSFERARRDVAAPAKASAGSAPSVSPAEERPSPAPAGGPAASFSPTTAAENPSPALPLHSFATSKSVVGSARAGGGLTGFDGADVKTQKMPDLEGRLEFELEPGLPKAGEAFIVRVYLINDGKKAARLRAVVLTTIVDGKRSSPGSLLHEHDVAAQQRGLVAEATLTWPAGAKTWSLEAVASSDRDETCTSRLTWQ